VGGGGVGGGGGGQTDNRALRMLFDLKREEVPGGWQKAA